MTPGQFCSVLNRFLTDGLVDGVFYAVQTHQVIEHGSMMNIRPVQGMGMIADGGISVDEYLELLERGIYSAVFPDGSIFYVELTFDGRRIHSHRYFYIPCPFAPSVGAGMPVHFELAEWLRGSAELEGLSVLRSVGTYRFDCVRLAGETVDPHPVSHLTFGSADCRIPVKGPLSVSSFLHFIFDNFARPTQRFWLNYAPYLVSGGDEVTISGVEMQRHHLMWDNG
ncbi:hypothetical protein VW23_008520 [Devosia insulae DS-56]|uniref:DUF2290 domain-containing protein n=1 Tax=Devosia insulae DS-56 TaxID=1116389 RepID=A0A1E5XWU4_9HYPH|nr:DUF2290 domain-containing protein [Devosia insulae]OEO33044.1 hypothetical protein VW23_008520 [Devosia insulae DS-56]